MFIYVKTNVAYTFLHYILNICVKDTSFRHPLNSSEASLFFEE